MQDLVQKLSTKLSGQFRQTVLALMMTPVEYDVDQLNTAFQLLKTSSKGTQAKQKKVCIRLSRRPLWFNVKQSS